MGDDKRPTLLRYAILKKKDKRIFISVHELPEGEISIVIRTKKLVDRKTRHIHTSEVIYGLETATIIKDMLTMLYEDPLFLMKSNREIGQLQKDRMVCTTDIPH